MGYISLLSFLINPKRRVFLVEPNREALKVAILNMLYNDSISQCTFYEAFASDQNFSETKLYTVGAGAAGSMYKSHAESAEQLNSFQVVRTITLDYLMEKYSTIPDFVKIDVEGAERFVLNGSRSLASRKSTRFFVEMHSNVELTMVENATQVLTWCQEVGYKAWYLKEHGELNSPGQIQTRGRCHLLLQPSEWEYPSFLNGVKENSELPPVL
jgi:FkbM family methyltransferase